MSSTNCSLSKNNFCHHRSAIPGPCHYLLEQQEKLQKKQKQAISKSPLCYTYTECSLKPNNFCVHRNTTRGPCHMMSDLEKIYTKTYNPYEYEKNYTYSTSNNNIRGCSLKSDNWCEHRGSPGPCHLLTMEKKNTKPK